MEIILLEKVGKLGNMGSIVTVKDGYGRNFLLPRNKAVRATKRNLEMFEARRKELEHENNIKKQAAEASLEKISGVEVTLLRQAGEDGRLFGSVSPRDIATALSTASGLVVDHEQVVIPSKFKQLGTYALNVELHPEVTATVSLIIARGDSEVSKIA